MHITPSKLHNKPSCIDIHTRLFCKHVALFHLGLFNIIRHYEIAFLWTKMKRNELCYASMYACIQNKMYVAQEMSTCAHSNNLSKTLASALKQSACMKLNLRRKKGRKNIPKRWMVERERYSTYHTWHHSSHWRGENGFCDWKINKIITGCNPPRSHYWLETPHVMTWRSIRHWALPSSPFFKYENILWI